MKKTFSQSCENNKHSILQILQTIFIKPTTLWEIGSGTGQHACYFASHLSHLTWQATDRDEERTSLDCRIEEAGLSNLPHSLKLNVTDEQWPCQTIEALFSANTLHIMHWDEVENLFANIARYQAQEAIVCLYGPFNYNGQYTSPSNQQFDQWLKARDPDSGIRDFEAVEALAKTAGLSLQQDHTLPANNRLLVFKK